MITEAKFLTCSELYKLELAKIKAVAEIEGRNRGFLNGLPIILFEPHVFYRELKKRGIDPEPLAYIHVQKKVKGKLVAIKLPHPVTGDIVYATWGERTYGPETKQHERLERACAIHREAALLSASWGMFQIMGFNWQACGCTSLQEFINRMYKSEDEHLELFLQFISRKKVKHQGRPITLLEALRQGLWEVFAEGYNGKDYAKHAYHLRLQYAWNKYRK